MGIATKPVSLDEFLARPETEPASEFICGEVVQKAMPSPLHGMLVVEMGSRLREYLQTTRTAVVMSETRHTQRSENRAYLPDIGVVLKERLPRDRQILERGPLEIVPDLAIEILSPDDRPGRVAEKVAFYLRNRVPLTWVIDPIERTLDAYRPEAITVQHRVGDIVDAAPVLPGFRLELGALFATFDDEEATSGA